MADKSDIFVAYAFSVGDVFIEIDESQKISRIEGALDWIGIDKAQSAIGRPITDFVSADDAIILQSGLSLLGGMLRLGPVRVGFGATVDTRRRIGLFLSRLSSNATRTHIVAMSLNRLDGPDAESNAPLADMESFLRRLPDILEEGEKNANSDILVSMLQMNKHMQGRDKQGFERQLAALSLGGKNATELGDGRFALVHEATNEGDAQRLMDTLASTTGQRFESATLDAETLGDGSDAAKALVYSIRKFSEESPDFSLQDLSENYTEKMEDTRKRIQTLRSLLKERQFDIAYQPIISLSTQKMHHVEALVRFDKRGSSPYELITFAEEVGMIGDFDQIMFESVVAKLRHLVSRGAPASIAVNLSARSLTTAAFVERLEADLKQNKELAGRLLIEVTESAQISDLDALGEAINKIRALGFAVCLDDFGAGLSGFQYLRHLKVDIVKIDGSYVRDAENDPESRAFLHAMSTLCRDLKIRTVGEWVETPAQFELLQSIGVDMGQGYLFGRPKLTLPQDMRGALENVD
ncbi:hypothetical protein JCM17845_19690 [Iodidimonas gelatinilytica]|uniref:EAL domain-containing protein n=1 Tax=Iodidimonas gelatinilytica TaxID=1236966 RepID=A0A5A7N2Q2_9PROT|nr:EAL domain-containing protein [Iodidimonas gelatinilytica]GER01346.1 hypothetical protein JCM17845_19690 [Iodidimonas gelatinilytica]